MHVTLIDSPYSNAGSIRRALQAAGADVVPTQRASEVAPAAKLVLPGVGSFAAAMAWLRTSGIDRAIVEAVGRGASLLGICVGHQLLFESSTEMGTTTGLGFFPGEVAKLETALSVPQIGWNRLSFTEDPLFDGIENGSHFYFVHSYRAIDATAAIARSTYGETFTAAARAGRVRGVQFHPEKSGAAGLRLLSNFVRMESAA